MSQKPETLLSTESGANKIKEDDTRSVFSSASAATGPSAATRPSAATGPSAAATAPTISSGGTKVSATVAPNKPIIRPPVSLSKTLEQYKRELTYPIRLLEDLHIDTVYLIQIRGFVKKQEMQLEDIIISRRSGVSFLLSRELKNLHVKWSVAKTQTSTYHQDDILFYYTDEQKAVLIKQFTTTPSQTTTR